MNGREDLLVEVANRYYLRDETMEAIGADLGVSRSSVSRLLRRARETGLVTITVDATRRGASVAESHLRELFGVRALVIDVRMSATPLARLEAVAASAAQLVSGLVEDGTTLGLAWGTTVSAVVEHLPSHPVHDAVVVQFNGAANIRTSGVGYAGDILERAAAAFDATAHGFPVPAFFDDARTKEFLWRERVVRRILLLQADVDVAVFGVGTFDGDLPSHVVAGGYLTAADITRLRRDRAVGDVCTVFLREDGSFADIEMNARASGPNPHDLARIPRRVCVVAGEGKASALLGALRSGAVTDLVVDDRTARAALDLARGTRPGRDGQVRRRPSLG